MATEPSIKELQAQLDALRAVAWPVVNAPRDLPSPGQLSMLRGELMKQVRR